MVTLLSLIIEVSPGPIQLIITKLDSTPLTVLTVQLITWGLPTIAPCMGLGGDMVTVGVGTIEMANFVVKKYYNVSLQNDSS